MSGRGEWHAWKTHRGEFGTGAERRPLVAASAAFRSSVAEVSPFDLI